MTARQSDVKNKKKLPRIKAEQLLFRYRQAGIKRCRLGTLYANSYFLPLCSRIISTNKSIWPIIAIGS
ncbi:hypothetical protein ABIE48_005886 [Paenibacillus sp. OAE614]